MVALNRKYTRALTFENLPQGSYFGVEDVNVSNTVEEDGDDVDKEKVLSLSLSL
jgi:hypothetical protein